MSISAGLVKELREKTGVGMMACKKALVDAAGDLGEAEKLLRKTGAAKAAKKANRATGEGMVASYIHAGGKIGVMVELNCETDFSARNDEFQTLGRNIAMHVAAAGPRFLVREEVDEATISEEREIATEQALKAGKPEKIVEKIVDGKMDKFFGEIVLMEQPYVKDPDVTIKQLVEATIAKIGENIQIRRYARFVLGD